MKPEAQIVQDIIEKALSDLLDAPESPYNKSARADLWYALHNQNLIEKEKQNDS